MRKVTDNALVTGGSICEGAIAAVWSHDEASTGITKAYPGRCVSATSSQEVVLSQCRTLPSGSPHFTSTVTCCRLPCACRAAAASLAIARAAVIFHSRSCDSSDENVTLVWHLCGGLCFDVAVRLSSTRVFVWQAIYMKPQH